MPRFERKSDDRRERPGGRDREGKNFKDRGGRMMRKKLCRFCNEKLRADYKDTEMVQKFLTEKGKIIPRRITGNCSKHQRMLARVIKRSRHSALIAFQVE